jgi:hypothetical protein
VEAETLAKAEAQVAGHGRVRTGKAARGLRAALVLRCGLPGGVAGESPAEGEAENAGALPAPALAARGRLPPSDARVRHQKYHYMSLILSTGSDPLQLHSLAFPPCNRPFKSPIHTSKFRLGKCEAHSTTGGYIGNTGKRKKRRIKNKN